MAATAEQSAAGWRYRCTWTGGPCSRAARSAPCRPATVRCRSSGSTRCRHAPSPAQVQRKARAAPPILTSSGGCSRRGNISAWRLPPFGVSGEPCCSERVSDSFFITEASPLLFGAIRNWLKAGYRPSPVPARPAGSRRCLGCKARGWCSGETRWQRGGA